MAQKFYSQVIMKVPATEPEHLVQKKYVDLLFHQKIKDAVRCVSGENIDLENTVTSVDGLTLSVGDRVLLINQTDLTQNGIYVLNDEGKLERSEDFNASEKIINNVIIPVKEGTQADMNYQLVNDEVVHLGTSSLVFARFKGDADVHSYRGEFTANGTDTEFVVTHGLNSKNVVCRIVDADGVECHFTVVTTTENTLTVTSDIVIEEDTKFFVTVLA